PGPRLYEKENFLDQVKGHRTKLSNRGGEALTVTGKLAKTGHARYTGNVSKFYARNGFGLINFGGKQIRFFTQSVPEEYLRENLGKVPLGAPVEFSIYQVKTDNFSDGVRGNDMEIADKLYFPARQTLDVLGLDADILEGAARALGCDPRENLDAVSLISPAPVQAQCIPRILEGEQLVIAAETGSGKTLAYVLPLLQMVKDAKNATPMNYGLDVHSESPFAVVVCPTRELAIQTYRVIKLASYHCDVRVRLVHGGKETWKQQMNRIGGIYDIIVCTPHRLLAFHEQGLVSFSRTRWVSIDEADFLLTQGFEDLEMLLQAIEREALGLNAWQKFRDDEKLIHYTLVTASITKPLWALFQSDKRWRKLRVLESKALHSPQNSCSHSFLMTKGRDKLEMLVGLMAPELCGRMESRQTLIFCNNISSCKSVSYQLREAFIRDRNNQYIGTLHKDMPCEERMVVMGKFARGEYKTVVCTDIAQRGLDLPDCGHVVNFDFPMNSIDYLHRAGRTARYGESGKVTSLVRLKDKTLAKAIERACQLGKPIDNLTSDRRDYLRGGALYDIIKRNPNASGKERGLLPPRPYAGSLR
ncbi:unnamed protein product, partial [Prorocentrum cordatum]